MKQRVAGDGSVYRRKKDGRWCAAITISTTNGKQCRKVAYGSTEREARKKLEELLRDQQQGALLVDERQTVQSFLERWLDQIVSERNKSSTHRSYSDQIRLHINPAIGHYRLSKLSPEHVQIMLNRLHKSGLKAQTVRYIRAILHRAFEQALRWNYVHRNVVALTDAPRATKYKATPLTVEQAKQLFKAVTGHRLEALYYVALGLGLRRGEILALRWVDIDLKARTLRVIEGKTTSSSRVLALPPVLYNALEQHWELQQTERSIRGTDWKDHGFVFPSEVGTQLNPRNLIRQFKRTLEHAGLPQTVRFHDLRHTCASFLIAQGVHQRVVMEILGHSQIAVTMDTYGHVTQDTQRDALEGLEQLFE